MVSSTVPSDFSVGVGSVMMENLEHYDVDQIFIHPNYDQNLMNDIALVKLSRELKFGTNIRPICFPEFSFQPLESDTVRAIGSGYTNYVTKIWPSILQEVDLKVIQLKECNEMFAPINEQIVCSQFCTWKKDKSPCSVRVETFNPVNKC